MRIHYILIIYALMFFSVSNVSAQTYTPNDRDTLAGIRVMAVIVERLDFEIEAEGLTLNQIQTDVELRLRRAGIRVEKGPLLPYLYINLNALKHKSLPMFAYSLGVDFNQNVILERDKTVSATASTWTKGSVGTVGEMNLQQIREVIKDNVDIFINDYLAANASSSVRDLPPPPPSSRKGKDDSDWTDAIFGASNNPPPPSSKKSQDDSPTFIARYVGGNRPPQIEVKNIANRILNLEFGKRKFVIPSGKTEVINTTDGGIFSFEATAPGVVPLKGEKLFERGYVYTWTFFIKKSR